MATLRTQYENYLFVNQEPHISFEQWERRIYTPTIESFNKLREETIKKWEDTGLLDRLDKDMTFKTQKVNLSGLMESDMPIRQQNALKNTFPDIEIQKEVEPQTQLEELNDYLKMLADMDKIGIRRKIVLLERYINKIKNNII
jgi:hypothetical protein